jgi:hypothetical protein
VCYELVTLFGSTIRTRIVSSGLCSSMVASWLSCGRGLDIADAVRGHAADGQAGGAPRNGGGLSRQEWVGEDRLALPGPVLSHAEPQLLELSNLADDLTISDDSPGVLDAR